MKKKSLYLSTLTVASLGTLGLFLNASKPISKRDQILSAMESSGLTPEQIFHHSANRLGYGASAVPGRNPSSFTEKSLEEAAQPLYELAGSIASEISTPLPLGYHSALDPYVKALRVEVDGNDFDPTLTNAELIAIYRKYSPGDTMEAKKTASRLRSVARKQMQQIKTLRAVFGSQYVNPEGQYRDRQLNLRELLQEFWFNHFNVDVSKSNLTVSGSDGYESMIHQGMYTTFYQLLSSVIKHPAMLIYLDNQRNGIDPTRGFIAQNQNLGRELLELHTLGQGPGPKTTELRYSQADVEDAARVLAGHNVQNFEYLFRSATAYKNKYKINGVLTEVRPPSVMKTAFTSEGPERLEELLRFLSNHPRTKKNICSKLTRTFVGGPVEIVSPVVDDCVARWGQDGNLKELYLGIVSSKAFWSRANVANRLKNPLELAFSQARIAGLSIRHLDQRPGMDTTDPNVIKVVDALLTNVKKLGLDPRFFAEPTGYKAAGAKWMSKGYLVSLGFSSFKSAHVLEPLSMDWALQTENLAQNSQLVKTLAADLSASTTTSIPLIFSAHGKQTQPKLTSWTSNLMICQLSNDASLFTGIRAPASVRPLDCPSEGPGPNLRTVNRRKEPALLQTSKDLMNSQKSVLYK